MSPGVPVQAIADDEALKKANRNDGEGIMRSEAREHDLFRAKAELREQNSSRTSQRTRGSPHRLVNAKASLSTSTRDSLGLDSQNLSIDSFVDDDLPAVEIENTQSLLNSEMGGATPAIDRNSIATSESLGAEDGNRGDMEQAVPASLPSIDPSNVPSESAPALKAVVVNEDEERARLQLESRQRVARSAVQAEVVDVKKRKVMIFSLLLFAIVVIGSLIAALTSTSKKRGNESPTSASSINFMQFSEWVELANRVSMSGNNVTYPPTENATTVEKALEWLIEEGASIPESTAVQRFAFVVMALSWNHLTAWNVTPGFDECRLAGVTCDTENGCVEINMKDLDLEGTIPPEIALLTDLRKLVLLSNKLSGTVPWEPMMNYMTNLQYLDLDVNELTGPLPSPGPGTWPQIEIFWTAWNQFTGTIPTGFAHLPLLQDLYVSDNFLTGTVPPELGKISTMNWFAIDDNLLRGTLPTEIGEWTNIRHLQVERAGLTGTIPTELGKWSAIKDFFAYSNNFNGTIPSEIGDWPEIVWFRTEYNDMTGTLPSGMGSWTKLTALSLNNNDYTGPLPPDMGTWTLLEDVQLNNNRFSGDIPSGLHKFDAITIANFEVNDFTGSLGEICNTTNSDVVLSADCCEVLCPCCSACFVDTGSLDGNCTELEP